MRVRYTKAAVMQLSIIAEQTTKLVGKKRAKIIGASLHALLEQDLPVFPFRGKEGRVPGTRELVLTHLPYLVVYRVGTDTIEILAMFHQFQEWPKEKN